MDFEAGQPTPEKGATPRDTAVLACKSKPYFQPRLSQLKCRSVPLTTGFRAPEAYVLEAAVAGWFAKETAEQIKDRAACKRRDACSTVNNHSRMVWPCHPEPPSRIWPTNGAFDDPMSLERQVDGEGAALAQCALDGHIAAMDLGDVLDDGQAQAGPAQLPAAALVDDVKPLKES